MHQDINNVNLSVVTSWMTCTFLLGCLFPSLFRIQSHRLYSQDLVGIESNTGI